VHAWFSPRSGARAAELDTGEGKSYWIPALEITGFVFSSTRFNRHLLGGSD